MLLGIFSGDKHRWFKLAILLIIFKTFIPPSVTFRTSTVMRSEKWMRERWEPEIGNGTTESRGGMNIDNNEERKQNEQTKFGELRDEIVKPERLEK